jgi:hypothetical protein
VSILKNTALNDPEIEYESALILPIVTQDNLKRKSGIKNHIHNITKSVKFFLKFLAFEFVER